MKPKKKTNSGEESTYDPLDRNWLRLGEIIDLARGATDWPLPPPPDPWKDRFKDLKAAVDHGELKRGQGITNINKDTFVSLENLSLYAAGQDAILDWLRDFCQRWRAARGIVLEEPAPIDSKEKSYAGRPSQVAAIENEMRRRDKEGVLCPTLAAEARAMCQWGEKKYPDKQIPKERAMQNSIRIEYWKLRRTHI